MAAVDASGGQPVALLVGAKDYSALARLGHGFERVVPVGDWLGPIVVPLMNLLRWVHGHLGNWGWSIVALTVLINLAMAPLRHYSVVNGIKMAKLGPEMRQIQDRYRKVPLMDPRRQQMQDEVAALYSKHGMNMGSQMLVGCLPLLLTMPFLFAFYRVLTVSIELRGASFLWIPDLAQKDPLFVTPVLMGAVDVRDAEAHAQHARPRPAAGDDADAAHTGRHVPGGARRAQPVLADVEPVVDPAAGRLAAAARAAARGGGEGQETAMKDRIFSGVDIDDAVAVAAANLGLPKAELRFVVLEAGSAGRPRPQADAGADRRHARGRPGAGRGPAGGPGRDGRRRSIRAPGWSGRSGRWPRPAGSRCRRRSRRPKKRCSSAWKARIASSSSSPTARPRCCRRTEHLLLRLYGAQLQPRAVRLTGEGFRERRDEALAAEARRIAAEVRAVGPGRGRCRGSTPTSGAWCT